MLTIGCGRFLTCCRPILSKRSLRFLSALRTTTLRVGHMGITSSPFYVLPTLSALEMTLRDLGHRTEAGAGVAAAQALFASPSL